MQFSTIIPALLLPLALAAPVPMMNELSAIDMLENYLRIPADHTAFEKLAERATYRVPVEDIPAMFDNWIALERSIIDKLNLEHFQKYGLGRAISTNGNVVWLNHDPQELLKANHELALMVREREKVMERLQQKKADWEEIGHMDFMNNPVESSAFKPASPAHEIDESDGQGRRRSSRLSKLKKEQAELEPNPL